MPATQGTLVLADISGYTSYMSGTEHEHSIEILRELLETIARSFEGRLHIDQLEGDALCATTERTDPEITTWLHETFGLFHQRLRDIRELSTCPCRACASAGFVSAPQKYDVGAVEAAYADLAPVKAKALADRVIEVTKDGAKLRLEYRFAGPPEQVWWILMDAGTRQRYLGVPRVDMIPGAKGTYLGAEFHCRHGKDLEGKTVFRITACDVPDFITTYMDFPVVGHAYRTDRLRAADGGTVMDVFVTWPGSGLLGRVKDAGTALMAKKFFDLGATRIREMIAEGLGADRVGATATT